MIFHVHLEELQRFDQSTNFIFQGEHDRRLAALGGRVIFAASLVAVFVLIFARVSFIELQEGRNTHQSIS